MSTLGNLEKGVSMEKNEVLSGAKDFCEKENAKASNKSIEFRIFEGSDQIIEEGFDGYDAYLNIEALRDSSFTLVARSRSDLSVFAQSTLFVTEYDLYKDMFFWQASDDRTVLTKLMLGSYKDLIGDCCISIGFTQFAGNVIASGDVFSKLKVALAFYKFSKDIVFSPQNFVYLTAEGTYFLPDEIVSFDELDLEDTNIEVDKLGVVDEESVSSVRFAEKMKMQKMDNLYDYKSLGPVYFRNKG
jgi:hypothetical protein